MSLTKKEFQVARLASFGLTNKEIADIQNVQSRSIESHLYNVYKKLSISGKKELPKIFLDDSKSVFLMAGCFKLAVRDKVRMLSNQGFKEEQISQRLNISIHRVQIHLNKIAGVSSTKAVKFNGLSKRLYQWAKDFGIHRFELSYRLRNGEQLGQILQTR